MAKNKSINPTFVIAKRELKAFFASPIAYIVTGLFLIISGIWFFSEFFLRNIASLRYFFSRLPLLFSVFVPALTMRLFSEERKSGSIETLLTLPVNETQVVMGKYLASLAGTLFMLLPTLCYVITVCIFGDPDFGPLFCGYLGAIFLSASYTAIGLFASSSTKNQIVAFFTGLIICIVLTMLDQFLIFLPASVVAFFNYISANAHFTSISRGIIDSRDLIYFISLTALFLVFTVRTEKSHRNS